MKDLRKLIEALQGDGFPEETILVCAGRSEGRRLLQQCAAAGVCLVGVTAESPMSLAMDLCAHRLSQPGAPRLVSDNEAAELILQILEEEPPEYYDREAAKDLAVAKELFKTFCELDMACISEVSGSDKLDDTQKLRVLYAEKKEKHRVWDRTDILKCAAEDAVQDGRRYVALSSYAPSKLERALLEKLAGDKLFVVPVSAPEGIRPPENALGGNAPTADIPDDLNIRSRFCRCRGVDTEVRFLFRDILEHDTPVEDCAVVYLSGEYAQHIHETAARFRVPVAMGTGVPMTGSGIYTLISQLPQFLQENYDVEKLCGLIETGVCVPPHRYTLAKQLRKLRVGWGKERYFNFLQQIKDEKNLSTHFDEWSAFFEAFFSVVEPTGNLHEQKEKLLQFLLKFTNRMRPGEAAAYAAVTQLVTEIRSLRQDETLLQRLLRLMENCTYMNSSAQPGKLFCVPLSQSLCTGRKKLYILGMSRDALQGAGRESPIMRDADRVKLSGMKTAQSQENENTFRLMQAVLQHEGEFVFCYPDYDSERMLEQQPCPVYVDLREAAGAAEETVTYLPQNLRTAGDHMLSGGFPADYSVVWDNGEKAELQSEKTHKEHMESFSFSCSSLEKAYKCPLRFYLENVLKLRKPDIPEYKDNRWLPATELGTFCHEVLKNYYQLKMDNKVPDLDELMAEECRRSEARNPVSRKELQEQDLQRARQIIEDAIKWTDASGRTVCAVERPFGKDSFEVDIDGRMLRLTGSIDRVDKLQNGTIGILDYKTGDANRFKKDESYHLQHYLYTLAEEKLSGRKIDEAVYLLLEAPPGEELYRVDKKRDEMANIVKGLLEWIEDEKNCMEWSPCLTLENGKMKAVSDEERECSQKCVYSEFCMNLR